MSAGVTPTAADRAAQVLRACLKNPTLIYSRKAEERLDELEKALFDARWAIQYAHDARDEALARAMAAEQDNERLREENRALEKARVAAFSDRDGFKSLRDEQRERAERAEARVTELERALEQARKLVVEHHSLGAMDNLEWGGRCPVCAKNDDLACAVWGSRPHQEPPA